MVQGYLDILEQRGKLAAAFGTLDDVALPLHFVVFACSRIDSLYCLKQVIKLFLGHADVCATCVNMSYLCLIESASKFGPVVCKWREHAQSPAILDDIFEPGQSGHAAFDILLF